MPVCDNVVPIDLHPAAAASLGFPASTGAYASPGTLPARDPSSESKSKSQSQSRTESESEFSFDSMEDALASFARGEFLVVMDDENRENEGDLIVAAANVTTQQMAWMIKHTRCA